MWCLSFRLGVTPVDSDEEALKLMNDSPYGLTAAIFTTDIERAKAMAPKLETGTVFMNRYELFVELIVRVFGFFWFFFANCQKVECILV